MNITTLTMASNKVNPQFSMDNFPVLSKGNITEEQETNETDNLTNEAASTANVPRYLMVESDENNKALAKLNPFVVEKAMKGIAGEVKDLKRLRSGALLVEVVRTAQAIHLLKQESFAGIPIRVSPHRSLNSCRGVITDRDLAKLTPDELVDEMQQYQVIKAQHIMTTRNGIRSNTNAIILTFGMSNLPQTVKVCWRHITVRPYIPNPLRCFKCQKFGHHQTSCRQQEVCAKCSMSAHGESPCNGPLKCVNCSGDHPTYAPSCPVWKQEKEICKIKVTQGIAYPEARRIVLATSTNNTTATFSSVVQSQHIPVKTRNIATQTEVTNCVCKPNFMQKTAKDMKQTTAAQTDMIIDSESVDDDNENIWITVTNNRQAARQTERRVSDPSPKREGLPHLADKQEALRYPRNRKRN